MQTASQTQRIAAIDTLRGVVMALMLLDHVREFFYLHQQVSDPMNLDTTSPALFFTRLASHFCAPVFVFLTGLGAWCYGQKMAAQGRNGRRETSRYLATRGIFLIVLELTLINLAWSFPLLPKMLYLQVIWAIGLSMLALAALLWLPRNGQWLLGIVIVAGHHLLDGIHFTPEQAEYPLWAILHDRSIIELNWLAEGLKARTSYPVLPWIGVILLGYASGPFYSQSTDPKERQRWLTRAGIGMLALFVALRGLNVYGDHPRAPAASLLGEPMAWLNLTKYPPSLLFVLFTLGLALLLLAQLEKGRPWAFFQTLGRVPMFFYVLHLYLLRGIYLTLTGVFGATQGERFGFSSVWQIWLMAALLLPALYPLCRRFADFKRQQAGGWTSYF